MNKKYWFWGIVVLSLSCAAIFGGNHYKKVTSSLKESESQLKTSKEENLKLLHENWALENDKVTLSRELEEIKESKDIEITETIAADGSSSKVTRIKSNKEKKSNSASLSKESNSINSSTVSAEASKKESLEQSAKVRIEDKSTITKKSSKWGVGVLALKDLSLTNNFDYGLMFQGTLIGPIKGHVQVQGLNSGDTKVGVGVMAEF